MVCPDEDITVSTTGIEVTFVIGSTNTVRQGGEITSSSSSSLNSVRTEIPELDVSNTSGTDFVRSGSTREGDVVNLVCITLLLANLVSRGSVENVDRVVIRHIDSSELGAVRRDSNALDSTCSLRENGTCFLLTSLSIPGEDERNASTLSSDAERSIRGHSETHNIVIMAFHFSLSSSS